MEHHTFTREQLAEGWRFGLWQNLQPDGKYPGGYVRNDGRQILRFERAVDAFRALRRLGFRDLVGAEPAKVAKGWGKARSGGKPTAHVCQVWPDVERSS